MSPHQESRRNCEELWFPCDGPEHKKRFVDIWLTHGASGHYKIDCGWLKMGAGFAICQRMCMIPSQSILALILLQSSCCLSLTAGLELLQLDRAPLLIIIMPSLSLHHQFIFLVTLEAIVKFTVFPQFCSFSGMYRTNGRTWCKMMYLSSLLDYSMYEVVLQCIRLCSSVLDVHFDENDPKLSCLVMEFFDFASWSYYAPPCRQTI